MNINTNALPRMISQAFVLGGKAIFTVQNPEGEYYTFRVKCPKMDLKKDVGSRMYFVSVLTGRDNESSYSYAGLLNKWSGEVTLTKGSKFSAADKRVRVIKWAISHIWHSQPLPQGYVIRHEGKCACCGRTLTTPDSLDRGIGPECWSRVCGG